MNEHQDLRLAATSSFHELLKQSGLAEGGHSGSVTVPTATTIVSLVFADGVIMAGDRRATAGSWIASKDIEKVFAADRASVVGIAGTAGLAIDLVRLFQVELEHYEKIEQTGLSLEGKANRLAGLLSANLPLALEGLAVVPIFAGCEDGRGRIFTYDITGGRYEEHQYAAVGSGSVFARNSLKKTYAPNPDATSGLKMLLEALIDAADDDAATAGPDLHRDIWPVMLVVDSQGVHRVPDDRLRELEVEVRANRRGVNQ